MNWSNCPLYQNCEDERKDILTYCDVACPNKAKEKTMGYTKGDWKLHLLRQKDGFIYRLAVTSNSGFSPIGEIYANNEKQGANARLIAAAPMLYEACVNMEKDLRLQIAMMPNCKVKTELVAHHKQARQALSKVETKNATIK